MTPDFTLEGWSIQPSGQLNLSFSYQPVVPLTTIEFQLDDTNFLDTWLGLAQDNAMSIPLAIKPATCVKVSDDEVKEAASNYVMNILTGASTCASPATISSYGDSISPTGKMAGGFTIPTNSTADSDEIMRLLSEAFNTTNLMKLPENTEDAEAMARFEAIVVDALEKAIAQVDAEEAKARGKAVAATITPYLDYRQDAWLLGLSDAEAKRMIRSGDPVYITPAGRVRRAFLRTDISNGTAMAKQHAHGQLLSVYCNGTETTKSCATMPEMELVMTYLHGNQLVG